VPTEPGLLELSECDRDCFAFLAESAGQHVPARRVCEELDRRGRLHAEITIKRSLALAAERAGVEEGGEHFLGLVLQGAAAGIRRPPPPGCPAGAWWWASRLLQGVPATMSPHLPTRGQVHAPAGT
jgi:hypothetical protein